MKEKSLRKKLKTTIELVNGSLRKYIANEALNYDDDCRQFFIDMQNVETSTGIANYFFFVSEIESFYNTYENEIDICIKNFESTMGKPIVFKENIINLQAGLRWKI